MTLAQLSLSRAGIPGFPGANAVEQLLNGRNAALAILRKYKPDLTYDEAASSAVVRQISVWEDRNSELLQQIFANPNANELPEQVRLAFGSDKAQAFIVAGFTQAAIGLGPWVSGAVERAAQQSVPGDLLQPRWAQEDAMARLQVFGAIVKMEQDGYLEKLFVRPSSLGFLPIAIEGTTLVWGLVVAFVAVAALILTYLYLTKSIELNNRTMSDLCAKAQAQGDTATVQACIEETAGLQKPGGDMWKTLGQVATVLGLAYLALKFLPEIWRKK